MHKTQRTWTQEECEFLIANYHKDLSISEIAERLNRNKESVINKARLLGISKPRGYASRKHFFDETVFDVYNVESCYWAGFLAADACIDIKSSSYRISLNLQTRDVEILEKIRLFIKTPKPIESYTCQIKGRDKIYEGFRFRFNSKHICNQLNKSFNITPRKSFTLQPPPLTDYSLQLAYIAGFFDGDGGLRLIYNGSSLYCRVSFIGNLDILVWIKDFVDRYYPTEKETSKIIESKRGNYCEYSFAALRAKYFIQDISQLPNSVGLSRKRFPAMIDKLVNKTKEFY